MGPENEKGQIDQTATRTQNGVTSRVEGFLQSAQDDMRELQEAGEVSRRGLLRLFVVGAAVGVTATACKMLPNSGESGSDASPEHRKKEGNAGFELSDNPSTLESINPPDGGYPIRVDTSKEFKIPNSPRWFPDTRTSWIRTKDGRLLVFGSAGVDSVRMEGRSWSELGAAEVVLGPDKTENANGYNGYRGFSTVFERSDGKLVAVIHKENWPSEGRHFPFTAEIEVATSEDEGKTWSEPISVITGQGVEKGRSDVQGVGQPGCIVGSDTLFTYYTDWQGAHDIHLAQVPLDKVEDPSAWKKWDGKGFNTPGLGGESKGVIQAEGSYAALPQMLWDPKRNTFVMLSEQDDGFYVRTSADGVNWSAGQQIVKTPSPLSTRKTEQEWYSYPTLIGGGSDQFTIGDGDKFLLASRGTWNVTAHRGVLLPVEIG